MTVALQWAGEPLRLLAQRALLLEAHRTVVVADVHLGKAATFRRLGVPVPTGSSQASLDRLTQVLRACGARKLVVLGDLMHSAWSWTPRVRQQMATWRQQHADLDWVLVRGNHDRHAGDPPAELGVQVVEEPWTLGGLAMCHDPQTPADRPRLAGHLHPGVRLAHGATQRLRLPCFHFSGARAVLPAFGDFTGLHCVRPQPEDRVFVIADDAVAEVPEPLFTLRR